MDVAEFDKFADEYNPAPKNIRTTEKNHEYIEGYKILNLPRVE